MRVSGIPLFVRTAAAIRINKFPQRRISQLRFASTSETAQHAASTNAASVARASLTTRTSAAVAAHTQALALLSLATLISGSVAFAAPLKKMESADATKAEELYNDNTYDRRTLLADLRAMHAGKRWLSYDAHLMCWQLLTFCVSVCVLLLMPLQPIRTMWA